MPSKTADKEQQNAVAVRGDNAVAAPLSANEWGTEYVGTQDIVIPKILPMQGLSKLVADDKAKMGEFRDSVTAALIGTIADPFVFIPFRVQKFWDIMEEDDEGNFKWKESIPLIENPVEKGYNDDLPWNDKVDGVEIKRVRRMNFFGLLPKEIEQGNSMPYVLSFKSTSFREGKKIFTQMYVRNKRAGMAPCAYAFVIGGEKVKNDKGTFVVPSAILGRAVTAEEAAECLSWDKIIRAGKGRVDDSDLGESVSAAEVGDSGTGEF